MISPTKYVKPILQNAFATRVKAWLRPRLPVLYAVLTGLLSLSGAWMILYGMALSPWGRSDSVDPTQKFFREDGAALVDFNYLSPQFIQRYGKDSVERLDLLIKGLVVYRQTPEATIYFNSK